MGTALKPYQEFDGPQRRPVSFEVSATVVDAQPLLLPIQPHTAQYSSAQTSVVHQPSAQPSLAQRKYSPSIRLQPQHAISPSHRVRPSQASVHLQPQLKVTSSALPVPVPVEVVEPQRGIVKPLPKSRIQPRWLHRLRVAQRCSAILATGLAASALVAYGTTVYTQHRWGNQYSELNQAEKERSLMDAFGESLKQIYAKQAGEPGSPLSGQPTPQYKIPLEPQELRPAIEIPPEDPMTNQPQNFPKGY